ncbi:MAG TPA: DUF4388 domain-containing protein [Anaerolineaceae bacterium]|nr:DUF4388 domain-containing protein [Anaerolineaceae bacterium]
MQGSIREMSIADIIQHNCQDRKIAELVVSNDGSEAHLYFRDGAIVHAVMGPLVGEEVIYHVLSWADGAFILEPNINCAETTIKKHWTNLLLEGAKRIDEYRNVSGRMFTPDTAERRRDLVFAELNLLMEVSGEFDGAAVVSLDGSLTVFRFRENLDEKIVNSIAVSALNIGRRSLALVNKGNLIKAVFQGDNGNIVVNAINPTHLFIGFSSVNLNLQDVLTAVSRVCGRLSDILQPANHKVQL